MAGTGFLQVGGARLAYRAWPGEGAPMLLVHGLASSLHIWDRVAPFLTSHFDVFAYNQRGHGDSSSPTGVYTLDVMLAELVGVLDALKLERAIVVGHSWGANLGLAFAARHPRKCAGMVLVDGGVISLKGTPPATWESISREMAPPDMSRVTLADVVSWSQEGGLEEVPKQVMYEYYRGILHEQPDGTVRNRLSREHHMEILRAIYDFRPERELSHVKAPLLAIFAGISEPGADRYTQGKWQGAQLLGGHPGARVLWVEDGVHDLPLQQPERLASEIAAFFA